MPMLVRSPRQALLALAIALAAVLPAPAQGPLGLWPEPADELVREALDAPYARALLKTFAASVRKNGDPSCLEAKALDDAASVARGRALLQRHGVQMINVLDENFDRSAYQSALSASAGPDAAAEIERLKRDPDVKALMALYRPAQLAKVVDTIMEQFDRYVLIGRIKLDPVSPIARGESELMKDNPTEAMRADPTQATEAAVRRFLDEHQSPRIDRYLDLLDAVEAATLKGFSTQAALKLGPMVHFAGVERDLAELCVGRR
jgi:hypothetical protein